ncbi:MAG: hypothetical protein RL154_248 [Pseudomonadota bacterium]|jgi:Fe-S-cluster-containing dehydrogenase component/DMSO reductase anchor subunit
MDTPLKSFIDYKASTGMQCGNYSIDIPKLKIDEQYRFHFNASACVGCHCCEAACNEQNGNTPDVKWRRVGEMQGGEFPNFKQFFNSMSCNHCIEPACLIGCPTNSYIKLDNGIVFHNDDSCIGCQYCTWNCPYQVPAFDKAKGIVTKCHMCNEKLEAGQTPSCVQACPAGAIEIEVVNKNEWIKNNIASQGIAPLLPDISITKPTTRYTLPDNLPELKPLDEHIVKKSHAEFPLVFMTTLSQISLGAMAALFLGQIASLFSNTLATPNIAFALCVLLPLALGLPLSALHLGRPVLAITAIKNLKTSWLSREAFWLGNFAILSFLLVLAFYFEINNFIKLCLESATLASGIYGIYAQSMIYKVKARASWNKSTTTIKFFSSSYLGFLLVSILLLTNYKPFISVLAIAILIGTFLLLTLFGELKSYNELKNEDKHFYQLSRTKILLDKMIVLKYFRIVGLLFSALILPIFAIVAFDAQNTNLPLILQCTAFALGAVAELIGRYLFFVTAVPYGLAGNFFAGNQRS